jgi:hypothetical protein
MELLLTSAKAAVAYARPILPTKPGHPQVDYIFVVLAAFLRQTSDPTVFGLINLQQLPQVESVLSDTNDKHSIVCLEESWKLLEHLI